jgi:hypothetical protein
MGGAAASGESGTDGWRGGVQGLPTIRLKMLVTRAVVMTEVVGLEFVDCSHQRLARIPSPPPADAVAAAESLPSTLPSILALVWKTSAALVP